MGNYSGKLQKLSFTINRKSPKQKLVQLIQKADNDYEDIAEAIVDKVIAKHKTVEKMIDEIINMSLPSDVDESLEELDDISCFIFNNDSYCSNFDYGVKKIGKDKVFLFVAYSI